MSLFNQIFIQAGCMEFYRLDKYAFYAYNYGSFAAEKQLKDFIEGCWLMGGEL